MDEDKWWAVIKVILVLGAIWSFYLYITDDSPNWISGECSGSGYMRDCD